MKALYPAILSPVRPDKVLVRFPDLPGCVTSGASVDEAVAMAVDAAGLWCCTSENHAQQLPAPSYPTDVTLEEGEFLTLIQVDTDAYRRMNDTRAVRKNVSLPAWMATQAERRGINCSQVLQDALRSILG